MQSYTKMCHNHFPGNNIPSLANNPRNKYTQDDWVDPKKNISGELLLISQWPNLDPWKPQQDSPFLLNITLCATSHLKPINFQSYGLDVLLISYILSSSSFLQSTGLRRYTRLRTDHKMHLDLGIRVKLGSIFSNHWRILCPVGSVHPSTWLVHCFPYLHKTKLNLKLCQDPYVLVLPFPWLPYPQDSLASTNSLGVKLNSHLFCYFSLPTHPVVSCKVSPSSTFAGPEFL